MHRIADLIGVPFVDGGRTPATGLDCWGLAAEVFRRFGIEVPDYKISCEASPEVSAQINSERPQWVRCAGAPPVPSLMVFVDRGLCSHVGVYLGAGKFIHAYEKTGVAILPTTHAFWRGRIEGYYVPRWANDKHSVDSKPDTAGSPGRT